MQDDNNNWWIAPAMIGLLVLLMLTASCAKIEVTPPQLRLLPAPVRMLPVNYYEGWARAIGWFDAHEAEISDIDQGNRFIEGRLGLSGDDTRLDCGTFHVDTALSPPSIVKVAKVRIYLRGVFAEHAEARINVTGHYKMTLVDNYAAQLITRTGPCVLAGRLERGIFAFLAGPF